MEIGRTKHGSIIIYKSCKQYADNPPLFRYSVCLLLMKVPTKEEFEKLKSIYHLFESNSLCAGKVETIEL